jgi:hypothetical protein
MISLSGEVSYVYCCLFNLLIKKKRIAHVLLFMMAMVEHLLYLCVISSARFDLMRMLHCAIAAKHMRFDAGENQRYLSYLMFYLLP